MADYVSGGATQNHAKTGAASRAENERTLAEMAANAPGPDRAYDAHRDPALNPGKITKLGQTIVRVEPDNPYWSPIIKISRTTVWASSGKPDEMALSPRFYAQGRAGKQANWYTLWAHKKGNKVEIDTGGATKSLIPLEEWRRFIDAVPVEVTEQSKNTVGPLTPELIKMARDVHAFRRQSPTCKEWKAEIAKSAEPAKKDTVEPVTGVVTQEVHRNLAEKADPEVEMVKSIRRAVDDWRKHKWEGNTCELGDGYFLDYEPDLERIMLAHPHNLPWKHNVANRANGDRVMRFHSGGESIRFYIGRVASNKAGAEAEFAKKDIVDPAIAQVPAGIPESWTRDGDWDFDQLCVATDGIPVRTGYDATCGMQDKEDFLSEWGSLLRETALLVREIRAHLIVSRVVKKRAEGYWAQLVEAPVFFALPSQVGRAVLPQDLQAASDAEKKPLRVWRNGTELHKPEWRGRTMDDKHDLHFETNNHGIPGTDFKPASINYVTVEHLIRTGGLKIEGDVPAWVQELIDHPAPAEPTSEASDDRYANRADLISSYPVPQDRIDRLFGEMQDAAKNVELNPITQLSDGFDLITAHGGLILRLSHKALPDWTFVVATRNAIDDKFVLKAQPEDAHFALATLKAANAKKQAEAQATAPQGTRVYKRRDDGHMVPVEFVRWDNRGLVLRNGADHDTLFEWRELDEMGRKREIAIEGKMPDQLHRLKHPPIYTRNLDLFVATRSGGGGFMKWDGNYLPLKVLINIVVCARCGCRIDNFKLSDVRADGFVVNARYRTCGGADRHVIRSAADVKWAKGAQERHQKKKVAGKVRDVAEAYPWLHAQPLIDSEAVPF